MRAAFHEWVERWQIGPGMNDGPRPRYSGFDGTVGNGWIPILDALAADLKAMGWNGNVQQIKEKFGTLRFYASPSGVPDDQCDAFYARIGQAEQASASVCEDCGAPGTTDSLPGRSWLLTLCASCRGAL